VSEDQVERLIEASKHASSARNIQPWELVTVKDKEINRQLLATALRL
jgi:nitroreductase